MRSPDQTADPRTWEAAASTTPSDDTVAAERIDLVAAVTELGENLLRVLAQDRRRATHRGRSLRELERSSEHLDGTGERMLGGDDHVAGQRLGIFDSVGVVVDRARWNALRDESIDPDGGGRPLPPPPPRGRQSGAV